MGYRQDVLRLAARWRELGSTGGLVPGHRGRGTPVERGWTSWATFSESFVASAWDEYAGASVLFVPGSEFMVLDVDMKPGKSDGLDSLRRLLADRGIDWPDQVTIPTVQTKSGGRHYYLRLPPSVSLGPSAGSFGVDYPGLDIRSGSNSYVVAPPSVIKGGGYSWMPGRSIFDLEPPMVPEALLEAILKGRKGEASGRSPASTKALPKAPAKARSRVVPARSASPVDAKQVDEIQAMLDYIEGGDDRDRWIKVGMCLHHHFSGSDDGHALWEAWSQKFPHRYTEGGCAERWDSFGRKGEEEYGGRGARTVATLRHLAKEGGWQPVPLPPSPPPPEPTLPTVTCAMTAQQRREIAFQGVALDLASGVSVVSSGPPGLSKTTAALEQAIDRLRRGLVSTVVMAAEKRQRVREIRAMEHVEPERRLATFGGRLLEVLGRSHDKADPFYCSLTQSESELYERGLGAACSRQGHTAESCGYLAHQAEQVRILSDPGPVLILTTIAKTEHLGRNLKESGREDALLVLDDPGPDFGLSLERRICLGALEAYRDCIRSWLESSQAVASEVGLAETMLDMLDHILSTGFTELFHVRHDHQRLTVEATNQLLLRLRSGPRVMWESSEVGWDAFARAGGPPPAFGYQLSPLLRLALLGRPVIARKKHGQLWFWPPNEFVIDRFRKGRAVSTSVGPMPPAVAEALNARMEHCEWRLENPVVRLKIPRSLGYGRSMRSGGDPTKADRVLQAVIPQLADTMAQQGKRLGVLLKKRLAEDVRSAVEERGGLVGYYGQDQAGTNVFNGVDMMVVQRGRPDPHECYRVAAVLHSCVGLAGRADLSMEKSKEGRSCPVSVKRIAVDVPKDSLARDVYRTMERQQMVNAVGRCRPLENPEALILIVDAHPLEGAEATEEWDLQTLEDRGYIQGAQEILRLVTKTAKTVELEQEIETVWTEDPTRDPKEILSLIDDPDLKEHLVRDAVQGLWARAKWSKSPPNPLVKAPCGDFAQLAAEVEVILSPSWSEGRRRLSSMVAQQTGLSRNTVSKRLKELRGSEFPGPNSPQDLCRNFLKVWRAVVQIAEERIEMSSLGKV